MAVRTSPSRLLRLVVLLAALDPASAAFAAAKAGRGKAAKGKKAAAASAKGGGFGKAAVAPKGPTAAQLLKSSMDMFDVLERERAAINSADASTIEDDVAGEVETTADAAAATSSVTKWVVTLRSTQAASGPEFNDWVPVAVLALGCGASVDPASLMTSALGACVKEVAEGGSQAFPSLRKLGRDAIEYAYEPLDSFETHVFDGLQGRKGRRDEAAATLGLDAGAPFSAGDVKKAHRKLMMELHPDRFVGDDEGAKAAQERMLLVQEAYAELGGGTGGAHGSFYQSLGGKARVGFSGAVTKDALSPIGKTRPEQELPYDAGGWKAGVVPMTTSVMTEFVSRNVARGGAAADN